MNNKNPIIVANDLTIAYELHRERKKLVALQDISLEVAPGEFVVLVGPSGCGKTSFINAISGLVPKASGSVTVRGEEVTGPGPDRAMVFQDYALLPWRTVESNVRMPFEFQDLGISDDEKARRVKECLSLVDLTGFEKSFPYELSGGMKQRVGIARALITHPDILLADEPFAAIDVMTIKTLQEIIVGLQSTSKISVILCDHQARDLLACVDSAAIIHNGKVVAQGTPSSLIQNIDAQNAYFGESFRLS